MLFLFCLCVSVRLQCCLNSTKLVIFFHLSAIGDWFSDNTLSGRPIIVLVAPIYKGWSQVWALLYYYCCPAVLVFLYAILYGTQVVVEFCRHWSGLAVVAECEALAGVEVVDI